MNQACANDMTFVKPSYGDVPEASKSTGHSTFYPCRVDDQVLQKGRLQQLTVKMEPNTGLIQFWQPGKPKLGRNSVPIFNFFTPACIHHSARN